MTAGAIHRDPAAAARQAYDLIVVGGGVHGLMVALEAARRDRRALLLEQADFAAATSHNSLRILHGGLRYLQRLDLARCLESLHERSWWHRHFPDLVQPLPCLLPLRGDGPYRPALLRPALALHDRLARWQGSRLPPGQVIDAAAVRRLAPLLGEHGRRGGALWHDGFAPDAPRLLIELLRWACAHGARALNYVAAVGLIEEGGRLTGVRGHDPVTGATHAYRAPVVINAAGPWAGRFAAACGLPGPARAAVLAWNVAFRRPAPASVALGLRAARRDAQTWFLVPWNGLLLAGTAYAPWPPDAPPPAALPEDLLEASIRDLEEALPGLGLARRDVLRVFPGLLPAARAGGATPADRPVLVDHGARHGRAGLITIEGVKLTTARALAARAMARALPGARPRPWAALARPPARPMPAADDDWVAWRALLEDEAVCHLDDLVLRRSSLGDDPARALALAPELCRLCGWDAARAAAEQARLRRRLAPAAPTRQAAAAEA